ncbi:MAG TPA: hypothetical protein VEU33_31775 [Archangium sp.]|nr:hypothetical protein [Archangium sp.]
MGIVSIGEVVGSVNGGPSEHEPSQQEARAQEESTVPHVSRPEDVERELRVRAWRRTRLHAD